MTTLTESLWRTFASMAQILRLPVHMLAFIYALAALTALLGFLAGES